MKHLTRVLAIFFWKMGGPGLLLLGILDSSFIFAPLGNDLLVVAMSAHSGSLVAMLYYSLMSTIGSILGCLLVDMIFRRAGEAGLGKHLSARRVEYVKHKVEKNAAWALVLAAIAPPPFPFTPFVMGAAALQYSRRKMMAIVGVARMVRFTALGVLALRYGESILRWMNNPVLQSVLIGLLVVFVVGSVVSVRGWIKRSRNRSAPVPA